MRVLLVGDVHCRHEQLAEMLWRAQADFRIAAAIQVGDFGFYKDAMTRARERQVRYPVPLHVIDGNHEDHRWLRQALGSGAAEVWREELNLIYQPRPSVACFGTSKVGFMGGALHVDRPQRHNLLSRFPNYILPRQREHATALLNRERPELVVTHSCPARIGIGLRGSPHLERGIDRHIRRAGFDPGPPDDCGDMELSKLWLGLDYRPRAWAYGHFHCAHEASVEGTRFVCVSDAFDSPGATFVLWDTEEKKLLHCPADPSGAAPTSR
jgi:hypothetical protein